MTQNDSKRDSDSAAAGAGLAGTHRQRHAGRVDVPERLRAACRPSLHVPRAAEPESWFRRVGRCAARCWSANRPAGWRSRGRPVDSSIRG